MTRIFVKKSPANALSTQRLIVISAIFLAIFNSAVADERTQRYTEGERITVWVNKVGPYENPQETYPFYSLPFCKVDPEKWETRWSGLGEALEGNALVKSDYVVKFKKNSETSLVCSTKLEPKV